MMHNLNEVPVLVGKVSIDGIKKTNHDFIKKQLQQKNMFAAQSIDDVLSEIKSVKERLEQLEIFKSVTVKLDKCETPNSNTDFANLHVIFKVEELKSQRLDMKAMCGLDNSVGFNLEMITSNLWGRATKLDVNYHNNINAIGGGSITMTKPLESIPRIKCSLGAWNNSFDHWWSKFLETSMGGFGEVSMKSNSGQHQLRLETLWRETISNAKAPIEISKENGHSMKSSLKHIFTRDTRDDHVYPESGYRLSLSQEFFTDMSRIENLDSSRLANIHLKLEAELQKSISVKQFVFENTFNCGVIKSMVNNDTKVPIADRFFIGGPLTMRGFELRSMGPLTNDGCPVGSNFYIQHGFHLYSPLPFFSKEGYASLFRLHGFVTSAITETSLGSITPANMASGDMASNARQMPYQLLHHYMRSARCTTGLGIIFKLANAFRIELNYCLPLQVQPGDRIVRGFQFGIGILYT